MPLPITIPNTFANATATIPLSQLDNNFSTVAVAVNSIGNGAFTLANAQITGGTISNVTLDNVSVDVETLSNVTITNLTVNGNATLTNAAVTANVATITTATFGAGSNTAPSITTSGDTNTGIYFPAADTIAFTEGGVESMRIDSSGNLGLGVTPSVSFAGYKTFQIASQGVISSDSTSNSELEINNNAYRASGTATPTYINSFAATKYSQYRGEHRWFTSTGVPSANTDITFTQAMTLDASGNLGLGTTSVTTSRFQIKGANNTTAAYDDGLKVTSNNETVNCQYSWTGINASSTLLLATGGSERARIDSAGYLIGGNSTSTTPTSSNLLNVYAIGEGRGKFSADLAAGLEVNRKGNDGDLVVFYQDGTIEGSISVSGSTVSYNGGHLSRWAQMLGAKDESLVKGTVMSNLDEMNEYFDADGNPVPNEQLNKVKVSDVEGDANVAGVFVSWTHDEAHNVEEINMAMTGDMIIRIAQGVTVQKGDLLMSAGDGTAKPQGDDIVRSKTIAKVTSNHVTCTYDDGSYCVPCVLMAC